MIKRWIKNIVKEAFKEMQIEEREKAEKSYQEAVASLARISAQETQKKYDEKLARQIKKSQLGWSKAQSKRDKKALAKQLAFTQEQNQQMRNMNPLGSCGYAAENK